MAGSGFTVMHVSQPTVDGVAKVVAGLAGDHASRGWNVVVACPPEGRLAADAVARGAWHAPWYATRDPGLSVLSEAVALMRILSRVDPDLVHLHSSKAGLVGRLVIRGRRPTVFQGHGWSFHAVDGAMKALVVRWEVFATRWAHLLVCESEDERLEGEMAGLAGNWALASNSVDVDRFHPPTEMEHREARGALGVRGPVVVCVGRLCRAKGQDVLLTAWPRVREVVPDAELLLVGGSPPAGELSSFLSASRLPPGVRLAGQQDDVRPWLMAADIVAAPSRWDTHSIAILEAMACGRPVVATGVAGARESLGDTGAVVAVEDHQALADALVARLTDPELRDREGASGRERVVVRFAAEHCIPRVGDLYDGVLKAFRTGAS